MLEKDKWYCCGVFTNYKSPLMCLFIQQLFIEPLLCARQVQRCWRMGAGLGETDQASAGIFVILRRSLVESQAGN